MTTTLLVTSVRTVRLVVPFDPGVPSFLLLLTISWISLTVTLHFSSTSAHVAYRDSKLTSLLANALGGNSLTLMIACIARADAYSAENLNTLTYAARASRIRNVAEVNEDAQTAEVRRLRAEVVDLRRQIQQVSGREGDREEERWLSQCDSSVSTHLCATRALGPTHSKLYPSQFHRNSLSL